MMKRGLVWIVAPVLALLLVPLRWAPAQDPEGLLKEAIDFYERGRDAEALDKLKAVIAADPSSEMAFKLRTSVETTMWARAMIKGNEHAAVIKHLFDLSIPAEKAKAKDDAAIGALILKMESGDVPERQRASLTLAADHGEYAVPHLVGRLKSDSSETRAQTMEWLRRLGVQAVMPLVQALEIGDPMIAANALTVLGQIRDRRAFPYVAAYAQAPASVPETVRAAATRALGRMGAPSGDLPGLFLQLAESYYRRDTAVVDPFRATYIAWSCADGKLVASEVPRELYHLKLAEEVCYDILAWDPANMDARILLGSVLVAEQEAVAGSDPEGPGKALAGATEMTTSLGADVMDGVLRKALADSRPEVAAGAVKALAKLTDADSFNPQGGLVQALSAPFREVRILAGLAVAHIHPRSGFGGSEQVVAALMEAVGQDAVKTAVVIDDNAETRNRMVGDLNARGWFAYGAATGPEGLTAVRSYPVEDLVVIRYDLQDATVAEVVKALRADPKSQDKPVVILAEAAKIAGAKESWSDKAQGFVESPPVVESYEPTLRELVKITDPAREAATLLAAKAATTLAHMDPRGGVLPTAGAVPALVGSLKGDDRVRTPAIQALGRIADISSAPALLEVFGDASASEAVRGNAAVALARIARAAGSVPAEIAAAMTAAVAGAGGREYIEMLGQACGILPLDPAARAQLLATLRPKIRVDLVE